MVTSSTLVDRVKIFVESSGSGPFELGNALPAFRGSEVLVDGLTYSYAVENGADYEAGQGVYVSAVNQLLRSPTISSASGAPVSFPANVALNFTALAADLLAGQAGTGTVTSVNGSGGLTGLTLSGGPIEGAGTLTLGGVLAVESGGTAAITASAARTNLGLGNVDNTSDAAKPISSATQAALDMKVGSAALAAAGGAGLVGWQQAGSSAIVRDLLSKVRETVSIADYGAHPDDSAADITAAYHAAMTYLMDRQPNDAAYYPAGPGEPTTGGYVDFTRRNRITGMIHTPPNRYWVSPNIFSSLINARAPFVGFAFVGEGKRSSVLLLETGGVDSWFYDNGPGNERYQLMLFRDMGFRADDWSKGSFAKLTSAGGPKQLHADNCEFSNMYRFLWTEGNGNADLNRATFCNFELYNDILTLNNDQSVQHDFINNHYRVWGDWVHVKQFGGGNVNFTNSSADHIWDSRFSPPEGNFLFTHDANANIGQGNHTFTFRDIRLELEAVTDKIGNRASTNAAGYAVGVGTVTLAAFGTGAIAIGDKVQFGMDPTRYTITSGDSDISNGGSISFTPTLVYAIPAVASPIYVNDPPLGLFTSTDNPNTAFPRVTFDNVNVVNGRTQLTNGAGTVLSESYRRITAFNIFPRKWVEVINCTLTKNMFIQKGGDRDTGSPNMGGVLLIDKSFDGINEELPAADASNTMMRFLHQRVKRTPGSSSGRVITRDMVDHTGGSSLVIRILDQDPDWLATIGGEPSSAMRKRSIKHPRNGFPLPSGANEVVVEIGGDIADGALYYDKPAEGSSTDAYQLHFGLSDKSVILYSSTLAQFKDRHTIDISHMNLSAGQYRVWATGTATGFQNGGTGWVECA